MNIRARKLVASFFLFLFCVLSAYTLWTEIDIFLFRVEGDKEISAAAGSNSLQKPFSSRSRSAVLVDCLNSMESIYGRVQPAELRVAHYSGCRDYALEIAETSPTLSSAWFVAAKASALLQDPKAFNNQIRLAYETSPREDWQSKRRVAMLIKHSDYRNEENEAIFQSDFRTIASSKSGANWVAIVYERNPHLRSTIMASLDQVDERHRRYFLNALKKRLH